MTDTTFHRSGYALDNAWKQARERLALLETVLDPGSIRRLEALGVGAGWHCLEVGGGGGSIAEWLCRRVGPTGRVLAIDIDTRFLDALDYPNLTVRQHDIVTTPLSDATFDLVHVRAVLTHLTGRKQVIDHMVAALKPRGWLLAEEPDYGSWAIVEPSSPEVAALWAKGWTAIQRVLASAGFDFQYGRRLYGDLCKAGLVDLETEGQAWMMRRAMAVTRFYHVTWTQLAQHIVGTGLLTAHELEQYLALYDDPAFVSLSNILIGAWGRRAAT
jgi:ubiquinone/menaquinone biosynthesis C-methylase UbiE